MSVAHEMSVEVLELRERVEALTAANAALVAELEALRVKDKVVVLVEGDTVTLPAEMVQAGLPVLRLPNEAVAHECVRVTGGYQSGSDVHMPGWVDTSVVGDTGRVRFRGYARMARELCAFLKEKL